MAAITLAQKIIAHTFARIYLITTILMVDDISDITLELSEREIYNDIRAKTTDTASFEDSYATKEVRQDVCNYPPTIAPGATQNVTVYIESGDTEITWLGITGYSASGETILGLTETQCSSLGGYYRYSSLLGTSLCMFGDMTKYLEVEEVSQTSSSYTFSVTNNHDTFTLRYSVDVAYRYLAVREILVRSTDDDSIAKYGRRVMNLLWSLGQHPNVTQQIADEYLARHKDPVSILYITVQGKDDRLINFILNAKVNDLIHVTLFDLNIDHDFWINSVAPSHRADGICEADFELEQQRELETLVLFELDTSLLDSSHVLAP